MNIHSTEITSRDTHEQLRGFALRSIIEFKRARRVVLGNAAAVFETRETVLFYAHELLRADGTWTRAHIDRVVAELQPLVPVLGQLTATVMIEGGDTEFAAALSRGIHERRGALTLRIADRHVPAVPADELVDPLYPLHYVRFEVGPGAASALMDARIPVRLVLRADGYAASASLSWRTRMQLADQLDAQTASLDVTASGTAATALSSPEWSLPTWTA